MAVFHRHTHRWTPRHILLLALVPAIAVGGFLVMYSLGDVIPFSGSDFNAGFSMLLLIVLGLSVPYAMLKLGVHETDHLTDQQEKDLTLKDIPKDKEQLWRRKESRDNYF